MRAPRPPTTPRDLALLGAILVVAAVVRLFPLARFAIWGSDSGEYLLLTRRLVEEGRVVFAYDGWGIAYPYFPGQFVVDGAAEVVLGLAPLDALRVPVPLLASLVLPLGVWLLARRVVGDLRVAAVAAAFVAITPVNALVTSHPMPGTLGHVFALAGLVALAHAYGERRYLAWGAVFALALVPTHHLSTWFFAGAVALVFLVREGGRASWDRSAAAAEWTVLLAAAVPAGAWWLFVARPFREEILSELGLPPLVVAGAGYALLVVLPIAVLARRALLPGATLRARYPAPYAKAALVAAVAGGVLTVLLALYVTRVPGGNIEVTGTTVAYALPVVAWLAFALAGTQTLHLFDRGTLFLGWIAAILGSLLFAVATESRVLFPFRHPDYLVEALAVPLALGMVASYDDLMCASDAGEKRTVARTAAAALAVLLVTSLLMSQPPREAIGGFEEGITEAELDMVRWAEANLPEDAVVAADHRLSSLLFGLADARPTWDSGHAIYHAEDWATAREALACADTLVDKCARVEYVVLSTVIREGVILVQWEDAEPMSDEALGKFFETDRFRTVYYGGRPGDEVFVLQVKWEEAA